MGRLEGKVALVTGAGRGQGAVIARVFVAEGAKVVLTDVLDAEGQAVAGSLGGEAVWAHLDVRRADQWKAAVDLAVTTFGKLDVLINNAGVFPSSPILEMDEDAFMQVIHINQLGVWLGMRAVAREMEKAGGGSIVNTASIAGVTGLPGLSAYVSSKHAVRGLTKTAALEFGPMGIRVNAILPGAVFGDSVGAELDPETVKALFADLPLRRPGTPDEMAKAMVYLASDESSYCTGSELLIDGGSQAGRSPTRAST